MTADSSLAYEPRPSAFGKAQEVAKHLGPEWSAIDREAQWTASIHGPGLRSLSLNMGTWRNGRLTIIGSTERLDRAYRDDRVQKWANDPMPSISVDPNKDGESIAKDIVRRLSDDYERAYAHMAEKYETMKAVIAERERAAGDLMAMLGARPSLNFPFDVHAEKATLCVDGSDLIRFSHTQYFTLEQMKRLICACPDIFGLKRPSLDEAVRRFISAAIPTGVVDKSVIARKVDLDNLRAVIEGK